MTHLVKVHGVLCAPRTGPITRVLKGYCVGGTIASERARRFSTSHTSTTPSS